MKQQYKLLSTAEKFTVVLVILLVAAQVYTQLELPSYTADIIDIGIAQQDLNFIYSNGGIMILISLASITASVLASFFAAKISVSVGTKLRRWVFHKTSNFSSQEYNKFGASTLITRNTNDIIQVQRFTYMMLRLMVMAPLMMVGGILKARMQSNDLSFIFWYAIPVLVLFIVIIAAFAVPLFKKLQEKLDAVNLVFRENLIGVRVIRAFNRFTREKQRFSTANKEHVDIAKRVNRIMTVIQPIMMIIMNFTSLAIVYFGAIAVDEGTMQVGSIFAFLQYAMQIMFSLLMVSMIFVMFPRAQASYRRVFQVLKEDFIITDKPDAKPVSDVKGVISFKDVVFKYPGAEYPVLNKLNFTAKPGNVTAIVGGTGSGKSTLINLIPRFYDLTEGEITLDGTDIRDITQHDLRQQIGYIPQTATLFSGSIRENLTLGNETATDEEIMSAIEIAQAEEFVREEDGGLERVVSQSGTNLSGGQKQRLSIARAIVRRPKIYIFDDSFSALDFTTDYELRTALKPHTKDATVFIVAQRISTITNADQIIVLDNGEIVGIGTHRDLLESCQVYKEIVSSQITEEEIAHE